MPKLAEQAEKPVDLVIFFDANMPKMPACKCGCETDDGILCKHRFNFIGHMLDRGNLTGLNDWEVTKRLFDLIDNGGWPSKKPRPFFVLVTKDHDFIEDLKVDYFDERQNHGTKVSLRFGKDLITRIDQKPSIVVIKIWIKHRASGDDRESDLRSAINLLNELRASRTYKTPE